MGHTNSLALLVVTCLVGYLARVRVIKTVYEEKGLLPGRQPNAAIAGVYVDSVILAASPLPIHTDDG